VTIIQLGSDCGILHDPFIPTVGRFKLSEIANIVTVRYIYAATAVSDKGQFQGAVPKGCAQGRQTARVYRELLSSLLPSSSLFSLVSSIEQSTKLPSLE
jgi:hypothetical protein